MKKDIDYIVKLSATNENVNVDALFTHKYNTLFEYHYGAGSFNMPISLSHNPPDEEDLCAFEKILQVMISLHLRLILIKNHVLMI